MQQCSQQSLHLCVRRSCWSQLLIPSHRAQNLVGMKPCTRHIGVPFLPDLVFPYLSARERVQESSLRAAESYPNILHALYYTPCSQLSRHVLTHNHKPSEATLVLSHYMSRLHCRHSSQVTQVSRSWIRHLGSNPLVPVAKHPLSSSARNGSVSLLCRHCSSQVLSCCPVTREFLTPDESICV